MSLTLPPGMQLHVDANTDVRPEYEAILTPEALAFIAKLHRAFEPRRQQLLAARVERAARLDAGEVPDFLPETQAIRDADWRIAPLPDALQCRRVEITGPVERKMIINALNSGADSYMTDFEDSNTPNWHNQLQGQINVRDAVRGEISLEQNGKQYKLNDKVATLIVRPRGWHLDEKHVSVDGVRMSGSLFDFGLHFFHNAKASLARGFGPYYYLPKLESHLEARLWNDVFVLAQNELGVAQGTIKATVLVETILAAFEMDEILYELREHSSGLNAGRWDYIFSCIKKFKVDADFCLADRSRINMTVPFMRAYALLLLKTCHHRNAPAIGGMSALIPIKNDPEANEKAMAGIRGDKARECHRRLRRRLGGTPGPRAGGHGGVCKGVGRSSEPDRQATRRREGEGARPARIQAGSADYRSRAALQHQRRHPLSGGVARWQRLRADSQPDGRCGDRRDLALAGVAVDSLAEGQARRWPQGHGRAGARIDSAGTRQREGTGWSGRAFV